MDNSHPSTKEMIVTLWARTDRVGSKATRQVKVDREDWEAMNPLERDEYMQEELWNGGLVEWGYSAGDYDGPG